jgi:hypothetical protein
MKNSPAERRVSVLVRWTGLECEVGKQPGYRFGLLYRKKGIGILLNMQRRIAVKIERTLHVEVVPCLSL